MKRIGEISRKTKETEIVVRCNLDGTGSAEIETGIGFFDHMLNSLSRHSGMDLKIQARGDLHVDVFVRHGKLCTEQVELGIEQVRIA